MRSLVHPHIGRNANVTIAITTAEPIRYRDETKIVRARVLRLYLITVAGSHSSTAALRGEAHV